MQKKIIKPISFPINYSLIFLILSQILLFYANFYAYRKENLRIQFAKGFGLNLRVITMLLFLSSLKSFYFIVARIENLHQHLGYFLVLNTIGHAVSHLLRKFRTNSVTISGIVLTVIVLLICLTSYFRKLNYSFFKFVHLLYVLYISAILIHTPKLWVYYLVPFLIFCGEKLYYLWYHTTWYTMINSRKVGNITFLSIPRKTATYPGSYYQICIPSISYEWHPFSLIGSVNSQNLAFFIDSVGDWTQAIEHVGKENLVLVQGPYKTLTSNCLRNPSATVLLIATGIGITPFFNVISTKNDNISLKNKDFERFNELLNCDLQRRDFSLQTKKVLRGDNLDPNIANEFSHLYLVWILRDVELLQFYIKYLAMICSDLQHQIHIEIYVTKDSNIEDIPHVKKGRPNISGIINKIKPDELYFCGSKSLKEHILTLDLKCKFYSEEFD